MKTPGRAKCSSAEFIKLFEAGLSVREIAKTLDMAEDKVQARRKRIENHLGISLRKANNEEYKGIREETIVDGVVIVGSDAHYWPGDPPTMHRAMVTLIKHLQPKVIVCNGDVFDGSSISRFPSIGWENTPNVNQELEVVQDRLEEIRQAYKNAKTYHTAGNHDLRFESRLAQVAPEYRGVKGIHLKDHLPGWIPCWAVDINRGEHSWTEIRHREKSGIHAAYRNTVEAGVSVVTGHDHRAEVVPYTDRRGRRYGVRTGMMADSALDPQFRDYMEAKRPNWQSAIGVLTYKGGDLMHPELCLKVSDGVVEFRAERIAV